MDSPRYSPDLEHRLEQAPNLSNSAKDRIITCMFGYRPPLHKEVEEMVIPDRTATWVLRAPDDLIQTILEECQGYEQNMSSTQYLRYVAEEIERSAQKTELHAWVFEDVHKHVRQQLEAGLPVTLTLPSRLRMSDSKDQVTLALNAGSLICRIHDRLHRVIETKTLTAE
jgi:hypothetical protein